MKMKEFGPGGRPWRLLDPPIVWICREQSNLNEGYDYLVQSCLLSSTVSDGFFCQQTAEWNGEILSIKV